MRKRKVQIQETIGDPKKTTMESAEPSEQSVMNAQKTARTAATMRGVCQSFEHFSCFDKRG